jgi:DNA-binding Lrp family transcriptional regulator
LNTSQFDSLGEELSGLLQWDPHVLKAYIFLLSRNGETMREELASGVGASESEVVELLDSLGRDGLIVRGQTGFYPVHPRLGISNVYRLSLAKNPAVGARRQKVDSLIAILASYRDRVEDVRFAASP